MTIPLSTKAYYMMIFKYRSLIGLTAFLIFAASCSKNIDAPEKNQSTQIKKKIPYEGGRLIIVNHAYTLGNINKGETTQGELLFCNEWLDDVTIRIQEKGCGTFLWDNNSFPNKPIKSRETFPLKFSFIKTKHPEKSQNESHLK